MSVKRFLLRIDKKEYLQSLANGHIFCNRIAKFRKMPTENSKIADSNEGLAKVEFSAILQQEDPRNINQHPRC